MRSVTFGAAVVAAVMLLLVAPTSAAAQDADTTPTFAKDIAPIFQKNCQSCHRPNSIAPMSFMNYQEVRPWARSIKNRVVLGEMPPYRYDRHVGIQDLKDDLRLTELEIATIARWVDEGTPLGDPADLPEPRSFPDLNEWAYEAELGPPDLVIPTKPYTIPAEGSDVWWRPIVASGLTEDRCLQAVSVRASATGRGVAHHANTQLLNYDEETQEWVEVERLSEYALGKAGEVVPEDACRILPADSMVRWDVHYYPNGERVENDVIEMGVWLYPKGHQEQAKNKQDLKAYSLKMKGAELELPPHGTAMTQGFHSFETPVRIDSFQPHGHFRLVGKTLEIFDPTTGDLEMISSVSNWTNDWHTSHIFADDAAPLVPAGNVLVITGYYDNTTANRQNPDPNQWVGPGSRSADEMSHAWIAVTHLDDESYEQQVAEREAQELAKRADNNQQ